MTSNFPMANNDAVADVIHHFTPNPKIIFVGYNNNAKKYIKKLEKYSLENIDFLNIGKDSINEDLSDYNIVVMHGGNPSMIKEHITRVQFDKFINSERTLVVTTSGSSCAFSKRFSLLNSFYPAWKNMGTSGLNYFPDEILPHFQRYKNKQKEIDAYALNNKVYALPDGTAISYLKNKIELIGEVKIL